MSTLTKGTKNFINFVPNLKLMGVRIYSWYPWLHTLFRFSFPVPPPPDLNTSLNCSLCNPSNYAYLYHEGYVVLVYCQNTPKGLRTTSRNSWTWTKSHKGDKRLIQGPLLLEDDDRRLRLPTTKEDIVLNLRIHIPFWVIILLSSLSICYHTTTFFSNYLLLSGQGPETIYSETKGWSMSGGSS